MYALKTKGRIEFGCLAKTKDELAHKIDRAFSSWRGFQEKGSNKTIDDFMEGKEKVKLTIERI